MDGVHFVQAAFLGCLWCFARVFIRSPSGRKRWNVLGAYDVVTGQLTTVANDGYINAMTVCEMLRKLAVRYAGRPIVIVLDNARYQHCKLVEDRDSSVKMGELLLTQIGKSGILPSFSQPFVGGVGDLIFYVSRNYVIQDASVCGTGPRALLPP